MKRRSFLQAVGGAVGTGAVAGTSMPTQAADSTKVAGVPRRTLGRLGREVSVVCFPGLALTHHEQDESTAGLHKAFDNGINYFDVAPAYGKNGACEIRMGVGLQGIKREDYVLSCKTKMRDKAGAREELERSLKRLKTDYFDADQILNGLIQNPEADSILLSDITQCGVGIEAHPDGNNFITILLAKADS